MDTSAQPDAVEKAFGHRFRDLALLTQACTHASRCGAQADAPTKRRNANERLEFLGDALLGGALCLHLFRRFPDADEGPMSRIKSRLVSRQHLAKSIEKTDVLSHCLVGAQMDTPWPESVKANLCEAILAAIYLDGGWEALCTAVERLLGDSLDDPESGAEDTRMRLQTWCLEHHKRLPTYTCERSGGTDHEPEFLSVVSIAEHQASGRGSSRRKAEADAAATILRILEV